MAQVQLTMPKMGESIMEATVLSWLKKPGDTIEQDESILEVATDKVDTEIPSVYAGVLKEILVKEGETIKVGSPIAILEASIEEPDHGVADEVPAPEDTNTATSANGAEPVAVPEGAPNLKMATRFYSPL